MEQHGDAKLTDLLQTLANCPKARSEGAGAMRKASNSWPPIRRTVDSLTGGSGPTSAHHRRNPETGRRGHIRVPSNLARPLAPQGWSCSAKLFPRKCPSL
jgi:hypothetical protein